MASQSATRKRPAPGTMPVSAHPSAPSHSYPTADSTLSNDQFLQWGQPGPPVPNIPAPGTLGQYPTLPTTDGHQPLAQVPRKTMAPVASAGGKQNPNPKAFIEPTPANQPDVVDPETGLTEEQLEERAHAAKMDAQAKRKQIPPFVQKLRSFLDESKNTDLIRWSNDGRSFVVLDEEQFARTLIPNLFKHSNYASFVRQLNMYGFHKKVGLSDNSMLSREKKDKTPSEYSNPFFRRGKPDLLWLIQKPKNLSQAKAAPKEAPSRVKAEGFTDDGDQEDYTDEVDNNRENRNRLKNQLSIAPSADFIPREQFSDVIRELHNIRHQQQIISSSINQLRRDHEQLYDQAFNFQEQHSRHENSINAILTFLATVYNRSLQGHEPSQGMINSFNTGPLSQEQSQGNIIDVGDFIGNLETGLNPNQRLMKKQPLLLKAPPQAGAPPGTPSTRANTMSPTVSQYNAQGQNGNGNPRKQSGTVEELFDSTSPQATSPQAPLYNSASPMPGQNQSNMKQPPQRDIMSLIQNTNARHNTQSGTLDFPTVLSSLENSGGNSPLTPSQRAEMLRMMANETHASDPSSIASSNNALITPTPPPVPHGYSNRLASTRAQFESLLKMQQDQDRSVQNLTNMLQPLSPTGLIPGLDPDKITGVPPPPLDLDQIFHSGDYFTDYTNLDATKNGIPTTYETNPEAQGNTESGNNTINPNEPLTTLPDELFELNHDPIGDLFADPKADLTKQSPTAFFDTHYGQDIGAGALDQTGFEDLSGNPSNRVAETLPNSEATSPANTIDENYLPLDNRNGHSIPGNTTNKRRKVGY